MNNRIRKLQSWIAMAIAAFVAAGPTRQCQVLAQTNLDLLQKEQEAFQKAADSASRYVVQIETFGGLDRVGDQNVADGPTTGTILTSDGWIISSLHSFRQQPASVLINLPDGTREPAKIVSRDHSRELALLKVDANNLPHIPNIGDTPTSAELLSQPELVGNWVLALGKTYDKKQVSRSVGIISALGRAYDRAIQTDAKISPINYGGPLIALDGRPLGILAPLSPGTFFEGDSSNIYDSGIGFAVPLGDIAARLPRMQDGQDIYPGKLGIVSTDQNELAGPVRIVGAIPGSAAAKAGIRDGDVLISAGDKPVRILANLRHAIGQVDAGQTLSLSVLRDGQQIDDLACTLTKEIPTYYRRFLGLRLTPLSAAEEVDSETEPEGQPAAETSEDDGKEPQDAPAAPSMHGLVIHHIDEGSPAAKAGLKEGQVLLKCDGQKLATIDDLRSKVAVAELDRDLQFQVTDIESKNSDTATSDLRVSQQAFDLAVSKAFDVRLRPTTWPQELPSALPPNRDGVEEGMQCKIVDVSLGDFTNSAYAIVPPEIEVASRNGLGLLLLFPDPGPTDREKAKELWEDFCVQQGWIVAVVDSADPKRWSMEESELAGRVLGRMQKSYGIDSSKVVAGGMGVGGRLAVISAEMLRPRIRGVLTIGTEVSPRFVRTQNMPLQSIDYLFVGEQEALQGAIEAFRKAGYAAVAANAPGLDTQKWDTLPSQVIQRWLEGLGRL